MKKILFLILALPQLAWSQNYTAFVKPMVGTAGHGHTYPGATLPYGMVQLSPDTRIDGSWDGCSGYHFSDKIIYGFSHTHLSGTGCSDYGDIMLMPIAGHSSAFSTGDYASRYSHEDEIAEAGYYSVTLKSNNVKVELTATQRTGFHKYTFYEKDPIVVLNLNHRDELLDGEIEIVNNHTIQGYRYSKAWAQNQKIFFYIEFSSKIESNVGLDNGSQQKNFKKISGKQVCANFMFGLEKNDALLVKVGISGTSVEGAKLNLQTENPKWDFEKVKKDAKSSWNKELGKIEVTCENKAEYEVFYTALYHTMIVPNVWNDVDGKYRGMDDKIYTKATGDYYTVFSLWDTFRAAHPLYTLIDQKRTKEYVETFMLQYEQVGRFPVWELASNETYCMIGIHSISVIADAVEKGLIHESYKKPLADAIIKISGYDFRGMATMNSSNYISTEDEHESVSQTLEYCYQYACMARICRWAGEENTALKFEKISLGYRNIFNSEAGFFAPRVNGGWIKNFDPTQVNNHYTEANGWQYTFFVPHDVKGMIDLYGGPEKFRAKLDSLFSTSSKMTGREQADITGLIGQYAHGNEPSHHVAYLYNYLGDYQKTASLVDKICKEFYSNTPDGLSGNEDCGQMSAWYVLSALGLYQVNPGSPYYTLTTPQVLSATIHLENGKLFSIQRERGEIKSIWFNDIPITDLYIPYEEIMHGGTLKFSTTVTAVGIQVGDILSTSTVKIASYLAAPVIKIDQPAFDKETWIEIKSADPKATTFYIIRDSKGKETKKKYSKKFKVNSNMTITAYSQYGLGGVQSTNAVANVYKRPTNYTLTIDAKPHDQYAGGGSMDLLDGIYGTTDWRRGLWLGYQEQDVVAIIDLKKETPLNNVRCTFLQDARAWIVFPLAVEFYSSADGINYTLVSTKEEPVNALSEKTEIREVSFDFQGKPARYLKIIAKWPGALPKGHESAGEKSYIFIDEIRFE